MEDVIPLPVSLPSPVPSPAAESAQSSLVETTPRIPSSPRIGMRSPSSTGSAYRDDDYDEIGSLHTASIHASLATLLLSEKYSDMTIHCGGRDFKAHRAIVCAQSSFFDKAFTGSFKEASSQSIELPDDNPDVLERFLEFLYTGSYSDGVVSTFGKPSNVAMMTPAEVQECLDAPPGVSWSKPNQKKTNIESEATTSTGKAAELHASSTIESGNESDDADYQSQGSAEQDQELEEEYNEFYEESSHSDDDEASYKDMFAGCSNRTEALQDVAQIRRDLELPLRLYVMADKYDVPALRLLARDRFYRAAELTWVEAECFPDVVDELYSCTPETDTAMREIVCRLVGNRIKEDEIKEKMRSVMVKHGSFAVGVMEYMIYHNRWKMMR